MFMFAKNSDLKLGSNLFSHSQSSPITELEKVQELLDGAILAAWRDVSPVSMPPVLTPMRWLWRLAGSYYTTRDTPRLLRQAAERFVAAGRWELAQWASERATEEEGHDQLALLDIKSMGYDPQLVVSRLAPPAALDLVNYFSRQVNATDPIGCVGYAYVLERLATRTTEATLQNIGAVLPSGINATRCLHAHSSIGIDANHVKENVEMVSQLTLAEQHNVAIACYETARMCFTSPKVGYLSEIELQKCLEFGYGLTDISYVRSSDNAQTAKSIHAIRHQKDKAQLKAVSGKESLNNLLENLQSGLPNDLNEAL